MRNRRGFSLNVAILSIAIPNHLLYSYVIILQGGYWVLLTGQIFTIHGEQVTDQAGFESGGTYVAVARRPFKQLGYRPAPSLHTTPRRILPPISRPIRKTPSPSKKQVVGMKGAAAPPPPAATAKVQVPAPAPTPLTPKPRLQSYTVTVQTIDEAGAGTDARVYLTMFGSLGDTGKRLLNEEPDNFGQGATDVFGIQTEKLGKIQRIRLEQDCTYIRYMIASFVPLMSTSPMNTLRYISKTCCPFCASEHGFSLPPPMFAIYRLLSLTPEVI